MFLTDEQKERIRASEDFWLATVKPEPAAHLIPIWAVLVGDAIYLATGPDSQKVRNLLAHPRAALALPDTRRVLILEGVAERVDSTPPDVLARFQEKYDWTLTEDDDKWVLVRFVPDKLLHWNS